MTMIDDALRDRISRQIVRFKLCTGVDPSEVLVNPLDLGGDGMYLDSVPVRARVGVPKGNAWVMK